MTRGAEQRPPPAREDVPGRAAALFITQHRDGDVVRTAAGTARVPVDDIVQIDRPNSRNSKWIGLGIGAAVDIIAVVSVSDGLKGIKLFGK